MDSPSQVSSVRRSAHSKRRISQGIIVGALILLVGWIVYRSWPLTPAQQKEALIKKMEAGSAGSSLTDAQKQAIIQNMENANPPTTTKSKKAKKGSTTEPAASVLTEAQKQAIINRMTGQSTSQQ